MKQVVNEHALALHTVTVDAAHGEVELQVYETQSGSYFAIDGSWLEQVPEDDKACYIPDPYNEGYSLQLIDSMEEKKPDLVNGEENQYLIDKVIEEMRKNIHDGDVTAIDELLQFVPEHILKGFLPDCPYCGGDCARDTEHACDGYLGDIDGLLED